MFSSETWNLVSRTSDTTVNPTGVYVSKGKKDGSRLHLFDVGFLSNHQVI